MPDELLEEYLKPVWASEQALTTIWREQEAGKPEAIAQGYERRITLSSQGGGRTISWTERQLIVRSHKLAKAAIQALHARLAKARAELDRLTEHKQGKKRYTERAFLQQAIQAILKQHCLEGLLRVTIEEHVEERVLRAYTASLQQSHNRRLR